MLEDYKKWLKEQGHAEKTQKARASFIKKIEKYCGSLHEHFTNGTYEEVIAALDYSKQDERENRLNPSKIPIRENLRKNLGPYKSATRNYLKFLSNKDEKLSIEEGFTEYTDELSYVKQLSQERFSLGRDMQAALRRNISSLDSSLKIVDDGAEKSVDTGFIDITCDDGEAIVVIELKAGKANSKAIGQILAYMGDIQEEEDREVRGILIAHDFDKKAKVRHVSCLT